MTNQKQKRSKESLQLLTKFVKEAIEETIAEEKEELIQADLKKAKTMIQEQLLQYNDHISST